MKHGFKAPLGRMFGNLLSLLVLASPVAAAANAAPLKILALGTSLTAGYGLPPGTEMTALIQARLQAMHIDAKVINAGVSGDTSAGGLERLAWSLGDNPDAAIVEFGGNDALRGLSPSETEKNLAAILDGLKARHIPVLLLGMRAPRNLGPEYDREFDAIYPRVAKKYGVLLYPFVLDGVAMQAGLNQADGIHPNPAGERIVADRIFPDVLALVRETRGDRR